MEGGASQPLINARKGIVGCIRGRREGGALREKGDVEGEGV